MKRGSKCSTVGLGESQSSRKRVLRPCAGLGVPALLSGLGATWMDSMDCRLTAASLSSPPSFSFIVFLATEVSSYFPGRPDCMTGMWLPQLQKSKFSCHCASQCPQEEA